MQNAKRKVQNVGTALRLYCTPPTNSDLYNKDQQSKIDLFFR